MMEPKLKEWPYPLHAFMRLEYVKPALYDSNCPNISTGFTISNTNVDPKDANGMWKQVRT